MKLLLLPFNRSLLAALLVSLALPVSAETWVKYQGRPGSKMRIDGTSTVHDWTVTTQIIRGTMELDSNFPLDAAKAPATGGKVNAKVNVAVPVLQLKSGKKLMDDVMHGAMKQPEHPEVKYSLKELALLPAEAGKPLKFDAQGELTVAGVTKPNKMQVTMEPMDKNRLKVTGETQVKMTDFGIKPPAPSVGLGLIRTGDEVKITFEWITSEAAAPAAKP